MNKRMDRNRLNIGAYILNSNARTPEHIKDVADGGIDFIVCMENDRAALDLFEKYGIGAVLTGIVPGWWGGNGENAGRLEETNSMESYVQAAQSFSDHPAVWGIDIGDEPSSPDMPYYGKVLAAVDKLFPNQFAYLNIYPNYASLAVNSDAQSINQLGTATYGEYIEKYCENVPSDYICYDFYLYSCNVAGHYENLCTVADACRKTGRSMWMVLQVNSHIPEKWITENQLRFQAYTAMAFGAENIIWACYTAGWWHNQVLDENGDKTEQYDKMKNVKGELHTLGEQYMRYRSVATHFVGDFKDDTKTTCEAVDAGAFQKVKANAPIVVGQMVERSGDGEALMICAADDPYDVENKSSTVTFNVDGARKITAFSGKGERKVQHLRDGTYAVAIASNEGVLIQAQ